MERLGGRHVQATVLSIELASGVLRPEIFLSPAECAFHTRNDLGVQCCPWR